MQRSWGKNGRGRGRKVNSSGNHQAFSSTDMIATAEKRFEAARQKQMKDVEKMTVAAGYESSSEEEDLDDDKIFSKLTDSYKAQRNDEDDDFLDDSTTQYLTDCLQSGGVTCLVCISSIKRTETMWSCESCYAGFHVECIKSWVLQGVAKATLLSDEYFPKRELPWYCPKCRHEYRRDQCPETYKCFCGAVENPEFDPWILPHSCGNPCNKKLTKPPCGHNCLLLCHPGPCPPCPQTVMLSCHCGSSRQRPRRCGAGSWSCGNVCDKLLKCGKHKCQRICHEGECDDCLETSMQYCLCRKEKRLQACAEPIWSCDKICNQLLKCGHHRCEKACHPPGECGRCPRSGVRSCPCGKVVVRVTDCREDVPPCNDTCNKDLNCYGGHKCLRKCHKGDCGPCQLLVMKPCRCGKRRKEVLCQKEYTCDNKCNKMKACGKHQCKRKCCNGVCPPCEQVCNRSLQCRKHKCQMLCHHGPCYPCPLTSRVSCNCGATNLTVVCGREKTTKPPTCRKPCKAKSNCHHPVIRHNCHFGDCPKCKQICGKSFKCGHTCPNRCHENVLVKNDRPLAPWEQPQAAFQIKRLPCRPCKVPIGVICRGGHEKGEFPCSEAKDYSCGRKCGRLLKCGNHKCVKECHVVTKPPDDAMAGDNCMECEEPCSFPRPDGCVHECPLPCHKDPCPPCKKKIRMRCHCGSAQHKFACSEWFTASVEEQEKLNSCGNRCPKQLADCGHLCPKTCHSGECPSSKECTKKVTKRCPCKRRKKEIICNQLNGAEHKNAVECDSVCEEIKQQKVKEQDALHKKKRDEEERKNLAEIERFERKMGKRPKRKNRTSEVVDDKPQSSNKAILIGAVICGLVAIGLAAYQFVI